MSAPFEYHPAHPIEIENRARQLLRLADETTDHQATTHQAHQPATTAWDGIAATELQAAPEPVRKQAEQVASQLSWAALPLRYWADQIRRFNNQVDTLLLRLAQIPTEVEHQLRLRYTDLSPEFEDPLRDYERDRIRHELINDLRRQWEHAYDTHIHGGARTAAGMLAQGPTYEYLQLARERALMPTGALVDHLAVGWDRTAAVQEAHRIATALLDPTATLPTNEEIDRLANLLDQYQDDTEFAYQFLTQLGPQGLLELTVQVATLTTADGQADPRVPTETIGAIQAGLAATLATATRRRGTQQDGGRYLPSQSELPATWVDELLALGPQRLSVWLGTTAGVEFYGYQALGVLLGAADYDSHFLALAGGALIAFEMQNGGSSFWAGTQHTDVRLAWTDYPISSSAGYDPMIGLMKALVGNPEATRELLTDVHDPADPMRLPRLDYLLTDRDWPTDTVPGPGQSIHTNPGIELFGAALEHAVAIDADERSYRIVEAIIYAVGNEASPESLAGGGDQQVRKHEPFPARDLVHEELRRHLGRIAAHYIEDLHWRIDGEWGTPETLRAGDMRLNKVDPSHLKYFFAELGKDTSARDEIFAASLAYADHLSRMYLDGWDGSDSVLADEVSLKVARPLGLILGAVDVGAEEAIRRGYAEADEEHNEALSTRLFWARLGATAFSDAVGAVTGGRPSPVGSTVSFLANTALDHIEEAFRHDSTGIANYYAGGLRNLAANAVEDMMVAVVYDEITGQVTAEEFLSRIPSNQLGFAQHLLYAEDHPLAGTLMPPVEWGEDQWDAWKKCKPYMGAPLISKPHKDAREAYFEGFKEAGDTMGAS